MVELMEEETKRVQEGLRCTALRTLTRYMMCVVSSLTFDSARRL